MPCQVELVPISEGNRVTIKENEKITVGRGSSLGCNDKKISRQHAELLLKDDATLWIKPTHSNPVFYRPAHGKTSHLAKDVEQQLHDGDQIGLLPTSFFFRVSISKDASSSNEDPSTKRADTSPEPTTSPDVEPKPSTSTQVQDASSSASTDPDKSPRKLPTWMSSTSSASNRANAKRQLSAEEENKSNTNGTSDTPKKQASAETVKKAADEDSAETFDSVPSKKKKSTDKPRTRCQYGASCYRKNPAHRAEESHPGDSDYEDEKEAKKEESSEDDKPACPYGKTCYRQNPQHKRDYKH